MDSKIKKYRRLEKYLNIIEFRKIRIGSLLAQTFELDYYNPCDKSLEYFLKLLKYLLYLFFTKNSVTLQSNFIFTKLISRFHFNELMDPLIIHYLEHSAILCNENSFDNGLLKKYPIDKRAIKFSQTINNSKSDIYRILSVLFKTAWILLKNSKRLRLSKEEYFFFLAQLLIQLRSVSFWNECFSKATIKPKCIITEFDRNSISSVLVLSARNYNITSITLTHGVICDYGFTPLLADYIFCWGRFQQKQLMEQGVSSNRILITGNPMIKTFKQKNIVKSDLVVCFAISPEISNRTMIEIFISAIKGFDQITGMVKLHPSLSKKNYLWIKELSSNVIIKDSTEITNSELFEKTDLLLIHQSGIANEALASGIPVVILEPDGDNNFSELQRELINTAGCKAASNLQQLIAVLSDFTADPELFKMEVKARSRQYLQDLFETIGEESVRSMILEINRLTA